ncbi:MAG: hypothetical protein JSU93_06140 [Methanobacteriota archaeon]|nr:MAG: hypothetical protein JSU93_06140 [Euryarchaeota archaeon]
MMPGQLSVNDRVLLHLSKFATDAQPEEYPAESTQVGIAEGVGISRTHVPRAVKTLIRDGFVEERRGRVADKGRRMSVYTVTPEGFRKAESIWGMVRESVITVIREGGRTEMPGSSLEELVGRRQAVALISRMKDQTVELARGKRAPVRDLSRAPERTEFFGRREEMETLQAFVRSDARVMVVMGGSGFGTTSLVREFIHTQEPLDVLWLSLKDPGASNELESEIITFAGRIDPEVSDLDSAISMPDTILVFDGYYSVSEEIVELFSHMVAFDSLSKVIVIAREDTPAYSWFYQRKHVEAGEVHELRIRGLDEDNALKLLGNPNIEPDAFRRVYLMTRGQPRLLRLLRDGDAEGLKNASVFTAEEVRYLLFLKDKTE